MWRHSCYDPYRTHIETPDRRHHFGRMYVTECPADYSANCPPDAPSIGWEACREFPRLMAVRAPDRWRQTARIAGTTRSGGTLLNRSGPTRANRYPNLLLAYRWHLQTRWA